MDLPTNTQELASSMDSNRGGGEGRGGGMLDDRLVENLTVTSLHEDCRKRGAETDG